MAPNFAFQSVPSTLPFGNIQENTAKTTSLAAYVQDELGVTSQSDIAASGRFTKNRNMAA